MDLEKLTKEQQDAILLELNRPRNQGDISECARFEYDGFFVRKIGGGAGGTTYLVFSHSFDDLEALKILKNPKDGLNEAKIMAKLAHDNIVRVHSAGYHFVKRDGKLESAILMEYVEGENLEEFVNNTCLGNYRGSQQEKNTETSLNEIIRIGIHIFNGLCYLHSKRVFHRDLNPRNIRYDRKTGIVKIIDFGISTANQSDGQHPESNTRYGGRNDLISLGQIIYKLVTGKNMFNDGSELSAQHKDTIREERERAYSDSEEFNQKLKQVDAEIHSQEVSNLIKACLSADGTEDSHQLVAKRFRNYINSTINLGAIRDHHSRERTFNANQWPKIYSFD